MGKDYTEFDHSDDNNEVSYVICIVYKTRFVPIRATKPRTAGTLYQDNTEGQKMYEG